MREWQGKWVGPDASPKDQLGVFAFRASLKVAAVPKSLPVRISADNRYKLFINGEMAAFGPQRGDERHWFYDELDLAAHLREGDSEIVALVWNFGHWAPMAQHTVRTAFVVDGEELSTPGVWEVARVETWDFDMMHNGVGEYYIDVGPGEIIGPLDLASLSWIKPHVICQAEERGASGGGTPWMLIPRTLPPMRNAQRATKPVVRRGFNGDLSDSPFVGGAHLPSEMPAGSKLLLDYEELLCAYPRLVLSGPMGSEVRITYAEALWEKGGNKGNRDEVAGKDFHGYQDRLILSAEPTVYEPLWWRTYRYVLLEASPPPSEWFVSEGGRRGEGDHAAPQAGRSSTPHPPSSKTNHFEEGGSISLHSLDAIETGYPYQVESGFTADDPWVEKIWDVSIRTAERCAGETYFDCPYYEQLQYVGDTRIQALISYYLGRDRALPRNAVETLGWSIMENGLTQSRYPSRQTQVIPPFSLWWVMMLYDQWLYDSAGGGLESGRTAWQVVLGYQYLWGSEGEFWEFCDWVPTWRAGVPPGGIRSAPNFVLAMLASHVGLALLEGEVPWSIKPTLLLKRQLERAAQLVDGLSVLKPGHEPGEHSETLLRILQETIGGDPSAWPSEALAAANAAKCTYYFSYYKHLAMAAGDVGARRAMPETGRSEGKARLAPTFDYMHELQPWKEQIEDGLTTFAENPEPTRSDCHAWSAHPILGFFQIVAGVTSIAPAWKKARIAPKPGSLKRFEANIAHPDGNLRVCYENDTITIDTPVPAELRWKGKVQAIEPGRHTV